MNLLQLMIAEKLFPHNSGSEIQSTESTPTLTPASGHSYQYGELVSLTLTNPPESGHYRIIFRSGSVPTTTVFPASILGLEQFYANANTIYEISVLDNRAAIGSWEVHADAE